MVRNIAALTGPSRHLWRSVDVRIPSCVLAITTARRRVLKLGRAADRWVEAPVLPHARAVCFAACTQSDAKHVTDTGGGKTGSNSHTRVSRRLRLSTQVCARSRLRPFPHSPPRTNARTDSLPSSGCPRCLSNSRRRMMWCPRGNWPRKRGGVSARHRGPCSRDLRRSVLPCQPYLKSLWTTSLIISGMSLCCLLSVA